MKNNQGIPNIGKSAAKKSVNQTKFTDFKIEMRYQVTLLAIKVIEAFGEGKVDFDSIESISDTFFIYMILDTEKEGMGVKMNKMMVRKKSLEVAFERYKITHAGKDVELKDLCEFGEKIEELLLKVGVTQK